MQTCTIKCMATDKKGSMCERAQMLIREMNETDHRKMTGKGTSK